MANSVKHHGRVYTPDYLVRTILDFGNYNGKDIVEKHVIDNSCGDGAFLCEIVERYCQQFHGKTLKRHLETYIHGIELDGEERDKCVRNLNDIAIKHGVKKVNWDVICADALCVDKHYGKMDYVFGNPPYVRVHNLESSYDIVKKFSFAQQGMTDLFIVFFELGFKMLNDNGTMCIITPSSWLSSKAGSMLRQYVMQKQNLSGIIDLGHFQPFEATTYTAISRFERATDHVELYRMVNKTSPLEYIDKLSIQDLYIAGNFYISNKDKLKELKEIKTGKAYQYTEVKNGFATLADKTFIGDFDFEGTIDVLKASTGKWSKCIFPYDSKGRPLPPTEIEKNKSLYEYLQLHKENLAKGRDIENRELWYLFGRTQAIKDVSKDKYALNTIIKDKSSIRLEKVVAGKGLYSGLYILTTIPENEVRELIVSDEFIAYIKMLANYKSGGYYTFASKDVEQYLNYKLSQKYGQSRISKGNLKLF
jgi:adenine-specific DNA-methyltransferase